MELIFNAQKPDIFAKFLPELGDSPEEEELAAKILKAYTKMKEKASKRNSRRKIGNSRWAPKVNDKVLVTTHVRCRKRNNVEIYAIVRGAISYFRNVSPFSLLAKG